MSIPNTHPYIKPEPVPFTSVATKTVEDTFRKAMFDAGLTMNLRITPDGKIHRYHVEGDKAGSQNGWYILFLGKIPSGIFGSWRTGEKHTWCLKTKSELTTVQLSEHKRRIAEAQKAREAEEQARYDEARGKALSIWNASKPAPDNCAYLLDKGVNSHGLRSYKRRDLIVPIQDNIGAIHSLQFINTSGKKRFLSGGRKKGFYFCIGLPTDTLCIAEGYATAASIYERTGYACAVAFDTGNLLDVAKALRTKYPEIKIILCADNDTKTDGNPGLTKARAAAIAVKGLLAIPPSHGDFNDMKQDTLERLKIEEIINSAASPEITETTEEAIERLSKLSHLEYEQVRKTEAQKLGINRVRVLDAEVTKLRPNEPQTQNENIIFPYIEPWPDPVPIVQLLDNTRTTIQNFIICDDETAIAATLWIAFTWFIDRVQIAPISMITAPEKRCGKSQLLSLIGKLACRPLMASNISSAAIYRVVEACNPTLLIDEADSFLRDNEEARGIINSGHTRDTAYVIRLVGDNHEPKQFSTWGAKSISGIGKQADTLMDRSVVLKLRRKLPYEQVASLRHTKEESFDGYKRCFARLALDYGQAVEQARPSLPKMLNDRAQDNWEPLLAIADIAGGHWPETARNAAIKISGKSDDTENTSIGVKLLSDIRDIFESKQNCPRISTADLLLELHRMENRPWLEWNRGKQITAIQIAKHLKPFGIVPKKMRLNNITFRGYELKQLNDAFNRYLDGTTEQSNKNNAL